MAARKQAQRKRKKTQSRRTGWDVQATVTAVLESDTLTDAAKALGVRYSTLWRRMQATEFRTAYLEARRQIVGQSIARLQGATGEAVEALRTILTDPDAGDSAKIQAARVVLSHSLQAIELEDLDERLRALEARHAETQS